MCYELSFLIDPENLRVYTARDLDSHSSIRRAWRLPVAYGAEGEWTDGIDGVTLRVRYEDSTVSAAICRWVIERWPTRDHFIAWLDGQETRDKRGLPMRLAMVAGSLVAQTTPRRDMILAREPHEWARKKFRQMRARVYLARKEKAYGVWSLRRLAAERLDDVLAIRLWDAPWGLQPDGCFLTIHTSSLSSHTDTRSLHLPGRGGVIAISPWRGYVFIIPESVARQRRAEARATATREQAAYIECLDAAAEYLMCGGGLKFCDGQKGGYFLWKDKAISANGVLRRVRGVFPPWPSEFAMYRLYDIGPSESSLRLCRGDSAALRAAEEY